MDVLQSRRPLRGGDIRGLLLATPFKCYFLMFLLDVPFFLVVIFLVFVFRPCPVPFFYSYVSYLVRVSFPIVLVLVSSFFPN